MTPLRRTAFLAGLRKCMMQIGCVRAPALGDLTNRQILFEAQAQEFNASDCVGTEVRGTSRLKLGCFRHDRLRPSSVEDARQALFIGDDVWKNCR